MFVLMFLIQAAAPEPWEKVDSLALNASIPAVMRAHDEDRDGALSQAEFTAMVRAGMARRMLAAGKTPPPDWRQKMDMTAGQMFRLIDADRDGRATPAELARTERAPEGGDAAGKPVSLTLDDATLARADTNRDGALDEAELGAVWRARALASVTEPERPAMEARLRDNGKRFRDSVAGIFRGLDANGDGRLTRDETQPRIAPAPPPG